MVSSYLGDLLPIWIGPSLTGWCSGLLKIFGEVCKTPLRHLPFWELISCTPATHGGIAVPRILGCLNHAPTYGANPCRRPQPSVGLPCLLLSCLTDYLLILGDTSCVMLGILCHNCSGVWLQLADNP